MLNGYFFYLQDIDEEQNNIRSVSLKYRPMHTLKELFPFNVDSYNRKPVGTMYTRTATNFSLAIKVGTALI